MTCCYLLLMRMCRYVQGFSRGLIVLGILDVVIEMRAENVCSDLSPLRDLVSSLWATQCNYKPMQQQERYLEAMSALAGWSV